MLIGQPWEIFRAENVTTDGRMIEIYTKGGDLIAYHSVLMLIPDYDLVATILVSGPPGVRGEANGNDVGAMTAQLVRTLLPAMEAAGKEEARRAYAGRYVDRATNSSLTLVVGGDEGPGMQVGAYVMRGVDVPATDPGGTLPPPTPPVLDPPMRYRMYPTTVDAAGQTSWRAVGTLATAEKAREMDALFPWAMASCITWAMMDRVAYEMGSRDHFVFDVSDGKATAVEAVGYAVKLVRETGGESGDATNPRATESQTGSGPAETISTGGAGRQGVSSMAAVVVGLVVTVMVGGAL
jgi:hypothetical protein